MTSVVVFAHPCAGSFGAAVCDAARRGLEAGGGDVAEVLDLYADGYRPGAPLAEGHRHSLAGATMLTLVHPTWWSAQPAILLGWLQHVAGHERPLPFLADVVDVATHGGRRLDNVLTGRAGRRTAAHFTNLMSGGRARFHWVPCYGLDTASADRRADLLAGVEASLTRTSRTPHRRHQQIQEDRWSSSS